jgi:hypothetical protein
MECGEERLDVPKPIGDTTSKNSPLFRAPAVGDLWLQCQFVAAMTTLWFIIYATSRDAINPSTPELNPSAQPCLTRLFTEDFAS